MANDVITLTYQVGEAWKGAYSSTTTYGNAAVVQDPDGLSIYRSKKSGNVGHPLTDTEWWFCIIDMSAIKATSDAVAELNVELAGHEAARVLAESERENAETGRQEAEASRVLAEQGRRIAETAREQGETNRNNQYAVAEGTESGSEAGDGSRWGAFKAAEVLRDALAAQLQLKLESGEVVPLLAGNLKSWAERNSLNVDDVATDIIRTTGGDQSIDSSRGARLISIVAQKDFGATSFRTTGFNQLHDAVALSTGYYFPVPAMAFGTFGMASQPNGVLFTDNNGGKLTPTVRFKALADRVPTSLSDGVACTYTDSNGYRFYTTPRLPDRQRNYLRQHLCPYRLEPTL